MQKNDIYQRVIQDIESVEEAYYERMERRNFNMDFYLGLQRTADEIDKMENEQGRKALIFNQIQPKVNHLIGSQTQLRMNSIVKGRERTDDTAAAMLTNVLAYVEEVNDIEAIEREVFTEIVVGGYGASVVYWHRDTDGYGYPKCDKVPMTELRWDGMARKSDFSDARWMARVIEMSRQSAKELFPTHERTISNIQVTIDGDGTNTVGRLQNLKTVRREMQENMGGIALDDDRDIVQVVEHYERIIKPEWHVNDGIQGKIFKFEEKSEAVDFLAGLTDQYGRDGEILLTEDGDMIVYLDEFSKQRMIQTIIAGDQVLEQQEIALPEFPYVVGTGYFDEGYAIGFVDNLIDPQIFYNDTMSTLDYIIGTSSKGAMTVVTPMLGNDTDINDLEQILATSRPLIPVKNHGAIQPVITPNPIPELYSNMQLADQYMITAVGGMNTLGLQQNASESGRAIEARAAAGGTGRLPLFDSLKKWRKNVALRFVWWIKNYMTPQQIMRIIGISGDPMYVQLQPGFMGTLRELVTDVVIDEASKTSTVRQLQFQQLQQLFIQSGIPAEVSQRILLKYADISEVDKKEIEGMLSLQQEYMQMQAQVQEKQKMEEEATRELEKRKLKDSLKEQTQFQTKQDAEKLYKAQQKEIEKQLEMQMAEMPQEQLQQLFL